MWQEIAANISFAPIGLLNMFNSSGAVEQFKVDITSSSSSDRNPQLFDGEVAFDTPTALSENRSPTATIRLSVRGCGVFGAYSSQRPLKCRVGNNQVEFTYAAHTGFLSLNLPVPEEEMHTWDVEFEV